VEILKDLDGKIIEQGSREKEDKELYADLLATKCVPPPHVLVGMSGVWEIGRLPEEDGNVVSIQMAAAPWVNRRCRFIASVTQS
jgi:hypothetical protein